MEWIAVGVIIAMFGFASTVLALGRKITIPMEKLNCSIVGLTEKFNGLTDRIARDSNCNEKEHVAIWDKVETLEKTQGEHTTDIAVLKEKVG